THIQIEDVLEKVNSGLPSGLSRIQQSNILRLGIRNEITRPGDLAAYSSAFQSVIATGCDSEWYDILNSSIDYNPVSLNETNGTSIPYAVCDTEITHL